MKLNLPFKGNEKAQRYKLELKRYLRYLEVRAYEKKAKLHLHKHKKDPLCSAIKSDDGRRGEEFQFQDLMSKEKNLPTTVQKSTKDTNLKQMSTYEDCNKKNDPLRTSQIKNMPKE